MCVGVCVRGREKADELHFLLAADRGSPARSPINRLKDKGVRRNERPFAFWLPVREGRGRGDEAGRVRKMQGERK